MRRFDENLIVAFATLTSGAEIMRQTGISNKKYYRLLHDDEFQTAVKRCRADIIKTAVLKMERYIDTDVMILQSIIENEEVAPQTRVNAISTMLTQLAAWKVNNDYEYGLIELEELKNDEKR